MRQEIAAEAREQRLARQRSAQGGRGLSILRSLLLLLLIVAAAWFLWVYGEIQHYAHTDEAHAADAIAVFGAAEYDGRPSPVLQARLEHALSLYGRGLAPFVITLGGGSGGEQHSEGGVGHDFLQAHGVPESQIIAETQSGTTEASARRLAAIARENHLASILAVSDGTHLFRIHALLQSYGLLVYTSPRPIGRPISLGDRVERTLHEMLSYTGWRLHIH